MCCKKIIIAAVKGDDSFEEALTSPCRHVFLLKANINTAKQMVERCHNAGKRVYIHIDLAEGFGKDEASLQYISREVKPDGIISTRINVIRIARDLGLKTVFRVFLIDAQSMELALINIEKTHPDFVELMPGIAYEAIKTLKERSEANVIAGGFLRTRENLDSAFEVGAFACSTSNLSLWKTEYQ